MRGVVVWNKKLSRPQAPKWLSLNLGVERPTGAHPNLDLNFLRRLLGRLVAAHHSKFCVSQRTSMLRTR